MELFKFRLVLRGTDAAGKRVRRVRTIDAPTFEAAWEGFAAHADAMAKGMAADSLAHAVYPPVGTRCNGEASRGYELAA